METNNGREESQMGNSIHFIHRGNGQWACNDPRPGDSAIPDMAEVTCQRCRDNVKKLKAKKARKTNTTSGTKAILAAANARGEAIGDGLRRHAVAAVRKGRECDECRAHYRDTLGCDEGKPVASPHRPRAPKVAR